MFWGGLVAGKSENFGWRKDVVDKNGRDSISSSLARVLRRKAAAPLRSSG